MNAPNKLLVKEIAEIALKAKTVLRNLSIGELIKLIRTQLGMTQLILAKRAGIPQPYLSRLEQGKGDPSLSTINKVLKALSCDLVMVPFFHESIEQLRRNQARKIASRHVRYLQGTMSLENQKPDSRLIEELIKQEEEKLLHGPGKKLWEEET
jgi:transcriptional regulator with XRE-family HTH domain